MKQLSKIIFALIILNVCLFYNTDATFAETLDCSKTLKSGASGEQVKILQRELNTVSSCGLTVDGSFGSATKTCVLSFQKANSLTQDASVGPATCSKLNEQYLKVTNTEDSTDDLICSSSNNLKAGSTKTTQVKFLQEKLNKTMGCNLKVDGSFGPATTTCVKDFQAKTKLTQDGVVGTGTCTKLKQAYSSRNSSLFYLSSQGNESTLDVRSNLAKGDKNAQVNLLQKELNKVLGTNMSVDGSFGSGTKTHVVNFQNKYNLTADGLVGASTASKLNVEYLKSNTYAVSNTVTSIRESTSTNSNEIAIATYGTVFKVYATTTANNITWYKIKYNGSYAYINSNDTKKNAIVLDISQQLLKLYKNGKLTLEAPVITGKKDHDTPTGRYLLTNSNIRRSVTLRGYNSSGNYYERYVNYWIEFIPTREIGFHDATWRDGSQFYNSGIYKASGSLGCVNMRLDNVKTLYDNIKGNDIYVFVKD